MARRHDRRPRRRRRAHRAERCASASGAACATPRDPDRRPSDSMWATPNSSAALTTGAAPSGGSSPASRPDTATTGSRSLRPRMSVEASTLLTSRSTRGRNAMEVERQAVAPQRRLGLGAADDIIPVVLVEICRALCDELMQVHEVGAGRKDPSVWLLRRVFRCSSGCASLVAAVRPGGEGTLRLQGRAATVQGRWGRIKETGAEDKVRKRRRASQTLRGDRYAAER